MFNNLVSQLQAILPGFGKDLAFDSKAISSWARITGNLTDDNRGDDEAGYGTKTYRGTNKDGTNWEKVKLGLDTSSTSSLMPITNFPLPNE